MDNQAKQVLSRGILGEETENPYGNLGEISTQEVGQNNQIDHQAAFEAQLKSSKNQSEAQNHIHDGRYAYEENGTYCRTGNNDNGFIETDLKIVKQKGIEERCVSFTIINQADTAEIYEDHNLVVLKMEMKSEEQFNSFKKFVANLEWDD